jgi:hypothetical protein
MSGVFQNIDPPTPSPPGVCVPPAFICKYFVLYTKEIRRGFTVKIGFFLLTFGLFRKQRKNPTLAHSHFTVIWARPKPPSSSPSTPPPKADPHAEPYTDNLRELSPASMYLRLKSYKVSIVSPSLCFLLTSSTILCLLLCSSTSAFQLSKFIHSFTTFSLPFVSPNSLNLQHPQYVYLLAFPVHCPLQPNFFLFVILLSPFVFLYY